MSQTLIKLDTADFAAVGPHLDLGPEAMAATKDCTQVSDALDRLEAGGFLLEATRLIAHALPRREAVWWACMCAVHTAPSDLPPPDRAAREAAENWVRQETDAARRIAWDLAQAAGCGTPEAWAAIAAFWSGNSMAPADQPPVPPAAYLAGTAAAGSVALASVRGDVTRREARLRRFLESARNVSAGGPGRLPAETA